MTRRNSGFTLIELVTVIVILGALAAVAAPRFLDLQSEAQDAAAGQVGANLESASSVNLAGALAGADDAFTMEACSDHKSLIAGSLGSNFNIQTNPANRTDLSTASTGGVGTCFLENTAGGDTLITWNAFAVPSASLNTP